MNLVPTIQTLPETKLIGVKVRMSLVRNRTKELWQSFMPRRHEISKAADADLYSVEVYDGGFFENFSPVREFEKWAAVRVSDFVNIPDGMNTLIIPEGPYAVFLYKCKPSDAQATYQYIYGNLIPNSRYNLDDRPHFALMAEKYKGEDPESEEEIWIPIKKGA